jgi:predicted secreted protein
MMWLLIPMLVLTAGVATPDALEITEADAGKEFALSVDQTAKLVLRMSGGTGYQWELDKVDEKILKIGEKSTRVLEKAPMAGGPVELIWPLRAVGKGRIGIKARLVRPWMKDKPAKEIEFTIVVK